MCVVVGAHQWERSELETEHSQVNVSGLTHGQTYQLRVVALGRRGDRDDVTSEAHQVRVGLPLGESQSLSCVMSICICFVYQSNYYTHLKV